MQVAIEQSKFDELHRDLDKEYDECVDNYEKKIKCIQKLKQDTAIQMIK